MIHLVGTKSNRDAVGSKVKLFIDDKVLTRWRMSSSGYLSQSDYRIHFGVGDHKQIDKIEIRWPTWKIQTLTDVTVNQLIEVKELQ